MRVVLVATATILVLGCAGRAPDGLAVSQPVASESMALIGRYGIGHACPVNGRIYTAAHVAVATSQDGVERPRGYTYQQGQQRGYLTGGQAHFSRDLADMILDEGSVNYLKMGSSVTPGERISWQEFELGSDPLRPVKKSGKVVGATSRHFTFRPDPAPGASGGCIFNERGEVIGVVVWSIGAGARAGVAVDITGES